MTPAVITTMIDEEWKRRSLTSTENHSRRTKRAAKRLQIAQGSGWPTANARTSTSKPMTK
jgi:hypothetical protein